jgi:hypothetical protein
MNPSKSTQTKKRKANEVPPTIATTAMKVKKKKWQKVQLPPPKDPMRF